MTTLAALNTLVSADLRDPSNLTFSTTDIDEIINASLAELGRIAPTRFIEEVVPVADTLEYPLRSSVSITGVASTNVITGVAHGFVDGDPVQFRNLSGGAGLSTTTTYYTTILTADTFSVSLTPGGADVDFTTNITSGTVVNVDPLPEIEVRRVEVWDTSTTPNTLVGLLRPASGEYSRSSQTGWEVWDGTLYLTNAQEEGIDPDVHVLRVQGYRPYPRATASVDIHLSTEREYALRDLCRVRALEMLTNSRELYSQWQSASHNTDVSLAALANMLNIARDNWRRQARALAVPREVA